MKNVRANKCAKGVVVWVPHGLVLGWMDRDGRMDICISVGHEHWALNIESRLGSSQF